MKRFAIITTVLLASVLVVGGGWWFVNMNEDEQISLDTRAGGVVADLGQVDTENKSEIATNDIPEAYIVSDDVDELIITDLTEGNGAVAANGSLITAHYHGTLADGTEFDSSFRRGEPFQFTLGAGQVIAGWDQGVLGMKVGGRRRLVIPPELGYGATGAGSIPPNAVLVFEIELVAVQ